MAERIVAGSTAFVLLTLVYMFVVVPLKTGALPPNMVGLFAIGLLLNAAWGIGQQFKARFLKTSAPTSVPSMARSL